MRAAVLHLCCLTCRMSELRASEILDDLCEDMSKYGLAKAPTSESEAVSAAWEWVLRGADAYGNHEKLTGDEAKAMNKRLKNYCYGIIERTEDSLAKYLASEAEHHEGMRRL